MDIKALMGKKVAGIPVVYFAALAMAVLLYGALKMKSSPDPVDPATDGGSDGGDIADSSQPTFAATPANILQSSGVNAAVGASGGSSTSSGSVTAVPQADTNDLWARRSVEYLTANGFTLDIASSAITKYLDSETLSMDEGRARDAAVKEYGLPPEGLSTSTVTPGVVSIPSPTAPGATTAPVSSPVRPSRQGVPPLTHTVKGSSDNTGPELARLYYGKSTTDAGQLIRVNNQKLGDGPWPIGSKVFIPAYHAPVYYTATSATRTLNAIAAKNGQDPERVRLYNPGLTFPVRVGQRVQVR